MQTGVLGRKRKGEREYITRNNDSRFFKPNKKLYTTDPGILANFKKSEENYTKLYYQIAQNM